MHIISISESKLNPLIHIGVLVDDLTPAGLGDTGYHLIVLSDDQFRAMEQLFGSSQVDIEDVTPRAIRDSQISSSGYLYCKGGKIPNGIKLRANYLSQMHHAEVRNSKILLEQKSYDNPSAAARSITKSQVNGWDFWEYLDVETGDWHSLKQLRMQ